MVEEEEEDEDEDDEAEDNEDEDDEDEDDDDEDDDDRLWRLLLPGDSKSSSLSLELTINKGSSAGEAGVRDGRCLDIFYFFLNLDLP